jgi:hypothetical protein
MAGKGEGFTAVLNQGFEVVAANKYGNFGGYGKKCRSVINLRHQKLEFSFTSMFARWGKLKP